MSFGKPRTPERWRVSTEWKKTAAYVKRRDRARCQVCGIVELFHRTPRGRRMSNLLIGHRVPPERYAGGPMDVANLMVLCRACNSSQGNRTPEEWQAARSGRLVKLGVVDKPVRDKPARRGYGRPRLRIY